MKRGAALGAAWLAGLGLWSAGCAGLSDEQAVAVVREYNQRLIEAYRASDVQVLRSVVGAGELKKVGGLIGVKADADLSLDSRLLFFEPREVSRREGEVVVVTEERWYYRDRRIGTGEQVGPDSTDDYSMRYVLQRIDGRWLVSRVEWAAPPRVGRAAHEQRVDVRVMHGLPPAADAGSGAP